jgi:hypothetical protein
MTLVIQHTDYLVEPAVNGWFRCGEDFIMKKMIFGTMIAVPTITVV